MRTHNRITTLCETILESRCLRTAASRAGRSLSASRGRTAASPWTTMREERPRPPRDRGGVRRPDPCHWRLIARPPHPRPCPASPSRGRRPRARRSTRGPSPSLPSATRRFLSGAGDPGKPRGQYYGPALDARIARDGKGLAIQGQVRIDVVIRDHEGIITVVFIRTGR